MYPLQCEHCTWKFAKGTEPKKIERACTYPLSCSKHRRDHDKPPSQPRASWFITVDTIPSTAWLDDITDCESFAQRFLAVPYIWDLNIFPARLLSILLVFEAGSTSWNDSQSKTELAGSCWLPRPSVHGTYLVSHENLWRNGRSDLRGSLAGPLSWKCSVKKSKLA